jgi:hypothetical protein
MIRTYSQLKSYATFEERFEYLKLNGSVGSTTFGFERYLNQSFYRSKEWKDTRHIVIARDEGYDLGVPGYEIFDRPIVHHMNPMTVEDIENGIEAILNPEYLILVTHDTHNAIHYGDASRLPKTFVERQPGDTRLW